MKPESDSLNIKLYLPLILVMTACTTWTQEDGKRLFAEQQNTTILRKENIENFLNPKSAVVLLGTREAKTGAVEYSFVNRWAKWFTPAEAKCRFILVVNKDNGTIVGWRYNGNPEYCTANP